MVFPSFANFTKKVTPGKLVGADKTNFFEVVMNTNIKKVDLDYTVQPEVIFRMAFNTMLNTTT